MHRMHANYKRSTTAVRSVQRPSVMKKEICRLFLFFKSMSSEKLANFRIIKCYVQHLTFSIEQNDKFPQVS